ncbi:DUF397 domain-containing protein [Actinomadura craniellae]|nr:DUF397 domain-containing protein [Actinomadura craniellae]
MTVEPNRSTAPAWRKSSRSPNVDCVEVASLRGAVAVRDSRDPQGPVILLAAAEWRALLTGIGAGDFDPERAR